MSYFQKYQKLCNNSKAISHTTASHSNENSTTVEDKQNGQSRDSYLKAFKKHYIDQFVKQQQIPSFGLSSQTKQNFVQHEHHKEKSKKSFHQKKESKQHNNQKKLLACDRKVSQQTFNPKINEKKVAEMVTNSQNQLSELIYNSISEIEREMMSISESDQLVIQNKKLRASIEKMKLILKQKLKVALAKNKEELTLMFDQYSAMIKKLLQDKQKLTSQLQNCKSRLNSVQNIKSNMIESYQNKIKQIMEQNSIQVSKTKQQIQQFLDMIVKYQEEASSQKTELDRLRQMVVQLQMENDKLKKEINCSSSKDSSIQKMDDTEFDRNAMSLFKESDSNASQSYQNSLKNNRDKKEQLTKKYGANSGSVQDYLTELERYAEKIQNLLDILDQLQEENKELNDFLKSCKCSRIKPKKMQSQSTESLNAEELKKTYEKKMVQAEKDFIREQMGLRQAIRKKDQCIERLTLVIQEMRKQRYESVDRITIEAGKALKK